MSLKVVKYVKDLQVGKGCKVCKGLTGLQRFVGSRIFCSYEDKIVAAKCCKI